MEKKIRNISTSILHLFKNWFSTWPGFTADHTKAQGFCLFIWGFWGGFSSEGEEKFK